MRPMVLLSTMTFSSAPLCLPVVRDVIALMATKGSSQVPYVQSAHRIDNYIAVGMSAQKMQ